MFSDAGGSFYPDVTAPESLTGVISVENEMVRSALRAAGLDYNMLSPMEKARAIAATMGDGRLFENNHFSAIAALWDTTALGQLETPDDDYFEQRKEKLNAFSLEKLKEERERESTQVIIVADENDGLVRSLNFAAFMGLLGSLFHRKKEVDDAQLAQDADIQNVTADYLVATPLHHPANLAYAMQHRETLQELANQKSAFKALKGLTVEKIADGGLQTPMPTPETVKPQAVDTPAKFLAT